MGLAFKIHDAESYRERLNRFLSDRCLLFNPYLIPDEQLIDAATHQKWRGLFSLTQMVILRFVRVECEKQSFRDIEHVTYRVGDSDIEVRQRMEEFTHRHTAEDSLQPIHHTINGKPVTRSRQIRGLVGKRVFVSRNIVTGNEYGFGKVMSMHRLTGDIAKDAAIVREAMTQARIEMLGRLLKYPRCQFYLDGTPSDSVDIKTQIQQLINQIVSYRPLH